MRRISYVLVILVVVIICMLLLFFFFKNQYTSLIVQTTHGPVESVKYMTRIDQKCHHFIGIPYAAPPITGIHPYTGEEVDRRFKAPEPLDYNWTEPLKFDRLRPLCQTTEILSKAYTDFFQFSEDCLFLNILVPDGGAKTKSVIVNIHGAGNDGGVTTDVLLRPDFLLALDNIVITIAYRVQMFGFLNLGYDVYGGNMALKDQQLALKWIYENIERFSGKKDEILVVGPSIGGAFVHTHMLNLESRKYFNRAFCISGAVDFWKTRHENHVREIQQCLKIDKTGKELVEYLKTANSSTLSQCREVWWVPSIESPNTIQPFMTQTPEEIHNAGKTPPMDAMFSIVSQDTVQLYPETLKMTEPWLSEQMEPYRKLPFKDFNSTTHPKEFKLAMKKLRKAYYENATTIEDIIRENIAYTSDINTRDKVLQAVVHQAIANNKATNKGQHKNTYLIRFSAHSDLNTEETKYKKNYTEAAHSDDLCYYFYCQYLEPFSVYENHLKTEDNVFDLIMRMVRMITNFARFGDPSIKGDTPFRSSKSSDEIYCHEISNDPKIRITMDIKKELKYDTWREIEEDYKRCIAKNTTDHVS